MPREPFELLLVFRKEKFSSGIKIFLIKFFFSMSEMNGAFDLLYKKSSQNYFQNSF